MSEDNKTRNKGHFNTHQQCVRGSNVLKPSLNHTRVERITHRKSLAPIFQNYR